MSDTMSQDSIIVYLCHVCKHIRHIAPAPAYISRNFLLDHIDMLMRYMGKDYASKESVITLTSRYSFSKLGFDAVEQHICPDVLLATYQTISSHRLLE